MFLMERLKQIPILVKFAPDLWGDKTKLVRHTTKNAALGRYINRSDENLEKWQTVQIKPVFHSCKFVVGFRGLSHCRARLVGVYKNISGNSPQPQTIERLVSDECISQALADVLPARGEKRHFYDLQKVWDARDLQKPLDIIWSDTPQGAISWHQWAHERQKTIIESRR